MLFLIMKKVILGATGSIGSSLAKKLVDSGEQVHLVGRDENSFSGLAKNFNSIETLKAHPRLSKFFDWVAKRPTNFLSKVPKKRKT